MTPKTTTLAGLIVVAFLLSGCAASRKPRVDDGQPQPVCQSTMIGSEPKTFCY